MIRAIVTDIEGTTTSIAFVIEVLFPYFREQVGQFLEDHHQTEPVRRLLDDVDREVGSVLTLDQQIDRLRSWVDADLKVTPLKSLQGLVWEDGYRAGDIKGHVYADAAEGLRRWHTAGLELYVYSSGSVKAQQLLFGFSDQGDLTPLFNGYFDTRIGPKREVGSYQRILKQIGYRGAEVLFLSDAVEELNAAAEAGMQTGWLIRGTAPPADAGHRVFADFNQIQPQ